MPVLADKGYQGAGIGVPAPTKNPNPTPDEETRNNLLSALRAPAERANAMFKHSRALQRVSPGPRRHHRDHGRRPRHHHPLARILTRFLTRILVRKAHYTICRLGSNPRSRRVYRAATAPAPRTTGSSPLARGLLVGNGIRGPEGGIIPARAGFTGRRRGRRCRRGDHPRSRGVYRPFLLGGAAPRGSSPLARGLRAPIRPRCAVRGIIPARAGFTVIRPLMADHLEDHPRSRGVYGVLGHRGPPHPGSSPLARGLLPRRRRHGRI